MRVLRVYHLYKNDIKTDQVGREYVKDGHLVKTELDDNPESDWRIYQIIYKGHKKRYRNALQEEQFAKDFFGSLCPPAIKDRPKVEEFTVLVPQKVKPKLDKESLELMVKEIEKEGLTLRNYLRKYNRENEWTKIYLASKKLNVEMPMGRQGKS